MSDLTLARSNGEIVLPTAQFTPTGWTPDRELSRHEWEEVGRGLARVTDAVNWWVGDWLLYGEFEGWGDKFTKAYELFGGKYELETLRVLQRVSGHIILGNRLPNISWTHHMVVANLDADLQASLLADAVRLQLSVRDLRLAVREHKRKSKRMQRQALRTHAATGSVNEDTQSDVRCSLYIARAEDMALLDATVDLIITSPPYNLGDDNWPMGGGGRMTRDGIDYAAHGDDMSQDEYEQWQVDVLVELYRVAKSGASLFYNHKVRTLQGRMIHPMQWLLAGDNPWTLRQEIIWDRKSTHNHSATLFWPIDERIYWLTKGTPVLHSDSIGQPTIWTEFGPVPNTWHPAPFTEKLPRMLLQAIGVDSDTVVLDPFAGSCTTLRVALEMGCQAIGVDISREYLEQACIENGWDSGIIY